MGERRTRLIVEDARAISAMPVECCPATRHATVVMSTGRAEQHDRLLGFEIGVDDSVEKPASLPYLKRAIERRLAATRG